MFTKNSYKTTTTTTTTTSTSTTTTTTTTASTRIRNFQSLEKRIPPFCIKI